MSIFNSKTSLNRGQIEIAEKFVDLHRYSVDAWIPKIERLRTSDDEAYQKIYFRLIGGEYGEVRCIVDTFSGDTGDHEIEICSSDSYSGNPVLFTFNLATDEVTGVTETR